MSFCESCGSKLEEGQVCSCKQQTGQEPVNQQPVNQQPVNQQPVNQQPVNNQQSVNNQQTYQQPGYQQPGYQQPIQYNNQTNLEEPMSVSDWIVTLLLLCIPCVNFVLMIVWAFSSSEKKSKSNLFKAYLILILIVIAIYVVIFILFGASIIASLPRGGYTFKS